jgi:NTP pyrophosphatase (non-canonical NTP hydrolase)
MNIDEFQVHAADTMQFDKATEKALSVALLGLSGEVGELSTEYKKKIRDGDNYKIFREQIIEELGDIIWYVSSIATIEDIELSTVLSQNLKKVKERWDELHDNIQLELEGEFPDDGFPEEEQLPREFVAEFSEATNDKEKTYVSVTVNGEPFGDPLRDNTRNIDFYRFHDIFHLSYATAIGWSPVVRRLLNKKRKTSDIHDEVEDGGRAWVIDEAISILVFEYARDHNFFDGLEVVDYQLLRTIKMLTRHLEIKDCTTKQWEHAILDGFKIWRKLRENNGGRVICNMHEKSMIYEQA